MGKLGSGKAKSCCVVSALVTGVLLVVAALCFLHFFPIIFHDIIIQQTVLANNSPGFQEWATPPAPIFLEFYIWDVENPSEVVLGAKPNITQRGPYVYREERPKVNITEHDNGTVSYRSPQTFTFDPEKSVGDPMNDTFTNINVPLLTIINEIQFLSTLEEVGIVVAIAGDHDVFVTHTVHDVIWGYEDPVLQRLQKIKPDMVPTTVFGLFAGRNNTDDGVYTVYTGETNYNLTNIINEWNGASTLPYWTTPQANMINGTDGTYNHPFVTKNDSIYVFSSDICRSIYALYLEETTVRGIHTLRFAPPSYLFANYTVYPPNIGFCTPNANYCYPGGLLNVSQCQFGAPVFMSSPHFLYADQAVFDMVNGVHPVEELHRTFFDIEPFTGGPLNVSKKLQINAHLRSYDYRLANWYKAVPEAYVPLVWINEHGTLTQESADGLWKQLFLPLALGTYGPWVGLGLGCLMALLSLVYVGTLLCRSRHAEHCLINGDDQSPLMNGGT